LGTFHVEEGELLEHPPEGQMFHVEHTNTLVRALRCAEKRGSGKVPEEEA
jgi:hypothetical protein